MEQHADETQDRVRQRAYELWSNTAVARVMRRSFGTRPNVG